MVLPAAASVHEKLNKARLELLDLGMRNSLLNYRPLKTRGVEVMDELPREVYRIIVRERKQMYFQAAPEKAIAEEDAATAPPSAPPPPPAAVDAPAARHSDGKLQTALIAAQLQKRLLETYYFARTAREEQGVTILYVALGMLKWYEADSSQEPRHAPLVLIPVDLERGDVQRRFSVRYTGADIGENLSLAQKLRSEFGLTLPPIEDADTLLVTDYFTQVQAAIKSQPRWSVDDQAVVLGFFSFAKFLMYSDLDATQWPAEAQPGGHPILQALLERRFHEPPSSLADDAPLDPYVKLAETHQVIDADSSQTLAMIDVNEGRNLVIEGPPGTGKSQTITNMIAEAVARGKTVLFVAEKMAALEVVERKLSNMGLGDICLVLHGQKMSKSDVLAQLKRTLDAPRRAPQEVSDDLQRLESLRGTLNDYADAVNTRIGASERTPYQAIGALNTVLNRNSGATLRRIEAPGMDAWSRAEFEQRFGLVNELQVRLAATGTPREHPFWGAGLTMLLPPDVDRLREAIGAATQATTRLQEAATAMTATIGLPEPATRGDAQAVYEMAGYALQAPDLGGAKVDAGEWLLEAAALDQLLAAGKKLVALHTTYDAQLKDEAWATDVAATRASLAANGQKLLRFISSDYRRSKRTLEALLRAAPPGDLGQQLALLDAISAAQEQQRTIAAHEPLARDLFGASWRGEQSDWALLESIALWLRDLHAGVRNGVWPFALLNFVATRPDRALLAAQAQRLRAALDEHLRRSDSVLSLLQIPPDAPTDDGPPTLAAEQAILARWLDHLGDLQSLTQFNAQAAACCELGLGAVVDVAQEWPDARRLLADSFYRTWLEMLLLRAFRERPVLAQFSGDTHELRISNFQELDRLMLQHNRLKVAALHRSRLPRGEAGGQLGLLQREFEKKSRHLAIRRLLKEAGNAVQAIKPVFMMSPLSVAAFIEPGTLNFDLVIFDEASQVRPVDAFGAILRGRQTVVVGDNRQLPPTSFFEKLAESSDELEESATSDIESILRLFRSQGAPPRMLRWHYRSRHESLIALSNRLFYDNGLVIFPSPDLGREESGLRFHLVPNALYDRGGNQTNVVEAQEVVKAIMAHAREHPEMTLGVVAFSMAQRQAIEEQLEMTERGNEPFFKDHPNEPFFIKNLENVQGDERDVILISVGYGRSALGGPVPLNFGPLNNEGGERRLNVLITRARQRCEVYSSLTADDIRAEGSKSQGVQALKAFLQYAQHKSMDVAAPSGREMDSPFEASVRAELQQRGYQVDYQVGAAGFFIDLAVVDPERPGRYLLGIECDGATYHSALSARDRDRLRQQVLEGLGWQIHRIWSTDWFRARDRELARLVKAIEAAHAAARQRDSTAAAMAALTPAPAPAAPPVAPARELTSAAPAVAVTRPPYILAEPKLKPGAPELPQMPPGELARLVAQVVSVESPVHFDEVVRRLREAAGAARSGTRIENAIANACQVAEQGGKVARQGDFLWSVPRKPTQARDRSALPAGRKLELIAPEEIDAAVKETVGAAFGMKSDEIPQATCRLFGFGRVSDDMRGQIDARVTKLVDAGQLVRQGDMLVLKKKG